MQKNGRFGRFWAPNARQKRFVKNLSKSVQDSFTICRRRWGILILPEGKTPARRHPFSICFLSFTFSFYPLFHFAWLAPCFPGGKQGASLCAAVCGFKRNKSFTGYSKSVHTYRAAPGYTEYVSKGSRNPAAGKPTDLLFLFYPPFSNLCSESAKRRCPVSPNGQRRFARASEKPDSARAKKPRACRGFLRFPRRYAEKAACAPAARKRAFSENLTKISQRQPSRALAKAGGMRYT